MKLKLSQKLAETGDDRIPNHGETSSLIQCAADDVPGRIVVSSHSLDVDGEPGNVTEIRKVHSVELQLACDFFSQSL